MAPTSLRGYVVQEEVKEGSIGTVYRVTDSRNRTLALKQISAGNAVQPRKRREFRKEYEIQKRLDHPAIVKVFDYVEMAPQDFFTMEYFESESLKVTMFHLPERIRKREFRLLRRLAEALEHVHSKGIIHKDIKPENVLVDAKGDIRLIDFSLGQTRWDRWLQFGKRVEGTPLYMAPEQVRGGRCDERTDIYAFGLLAYELLTKRLPFRGRNVGEMMMANLRLPVLPMRTHVPTLSPELDAFVLRLLQKDPARRPQDMGSVIRELRRWENSDTVIRMRQIRTSEAPAGVSLGTASM